MAVRENRVNLRMEDSLYQPYRRLAELRDQSVAELLREVLLGALPFIETAGSALEAVKVGEAEAGLRVLQAVEEKLPADAAAVAAEMAALRVTAERELREGS